MVRPDEPVGLTPFSRSLSQFPFSRPTADVSLFLFRICETRIDEVGIFELE
jgi:hypothetical protein